MVIKKLTPGLSVAPQISVGDIGLAAAQGFRAIINNRPEGESGDQPAEAELRAAAEAHGLAYRHQPVVSGKVTDEDGAAFGALLEDLEGPVLAFCRTGTRCATLWGLSQAGRLSADAIIETAKGAGYDLSGIRARIDAASPAAPSFAIRHEVVIVGGGSAGVSTAASLLKRKPGLDIAIIEPSDSHYYQPGWTLVGGGVFHRSQTVRAMADVLPAGVKRIRAAVATFEPHESAVTLEDGSRVAYKVLVAAPGLKLDWDATPGLREALGKNGVTSNYKFDLAPYTWELAQNLKNGTAIFTQPPMPIKCAGAPQKAMYLSADHWFRTGRLKDIRIEFCNAGGVLFGVAHYVPALMKYVEKYSIHLNFSHNLVAVDGPNRKATFEITAPDGEKRRVEKSFDMLHVCPKQTAPDFVRASPLADAAGWIEVNPETLQHVRYGDIFSLGDACSTPNAKTAAAARKQAPIVAENVLCALRGEAPRAVYDGYGSCPLTVERGKIVLAEFGYGGKLLPSLPAWLIDGASPSRISWFLKEKLLPPIYWHAMLKGREWLVKPKLLPASPTAQSREAALTTKP